MLISRERKLLFVHIQKTGGTSINVMLSRALGDSKKILGPHDHALWAKRELGAEYDELFKFAFVRNPWDRLVSWYEMIVQNWQRQAATAPRMWRYVVSSSSSFEEFVLRCTDPVDDIDGRKSFAYNQLDYITDEDGTIIVDFVGRFERLAADTRDLFGKLSIPLEVLPHRNPSRHLHYSQYYSEQTREIVAKRFARDISFFGYRFDESDLIGAEGSLPTA